MGQAEKQTMSVESIKLGIYQLAAHSPHLNVLATHAGLEAFNLGQLGMEKILSRTSDAHAVQKGLSSYTFEIARIIIALGRDPQISFPSI